MSTIRNILLAFLSLFYPASLAAQTGALVFIKSGDAWIMNTDGSNQTRLTTAGGVTLLPLSNNVLVYQLANQLYRANLQGFAFSAPPQPIPNTNGVLEFDLNPNGDKLTLTYYANSNTTLYTMDTDGSNLTAINSSTQHQGTISWARDGYIYFVQSNIGNAFSQTLYRIPENGNNNPVQLTNYFSQFPATGLPSGRVAFLYNHPTKFFRTMAPDGSAQQDIPGINAGDGSYFTADYFDDVLYYALGNQIFRVRTDGSNNQSIASGVFNWVDYGTITLDSSAPITTSINITPNPIPVNATSTLTANFTDAGGSGLNTAYYTVDGGTPIFFASLNGSAAQATLNLAPFTNAGIHTFCARAQDNAGNIGAYQCAMLAVYDPAGGFVTGGGWLQSLAGRSIFALVARYQQNQSTPTGHFQFRNASQHLRSTSLSWLVIAGNTATLRGIGEWNGAPGHTFEVTASSANPDSLSLKVWNSSGTLLDLTPTTLGGGQIIVH